MTGGKSSAVRSFSSGLEVDFQGHSSGAVVSTRITGISSSTCLPLGVTLSLSDPEREDALSSRFKSRKRLL